MSAAFDSFMQQYRSSGREKLDGYNRMQFDGMNPEERTQAERMLIDDAERRDLTAFQELALLGTANARETLEGIIAETPAPSIVHLRASEALWEMTGEERYQREIGKNLVTEEPSFLERAVVGLAQTRPTSYQHEALRDVLLRSEQGSRARSQAAGGLVRYYGFPPLIKDQTPERLALERKVVAATPQTIEAILEEVRAIAMKRGYPLPADN